MENKAGGAGGKRLEWQEEEGRSQAGDQLQCLACASTFSPPRPGCCCRAAGMQSSQDQVSERQLLPALPAPDPSRLRLLSIFPSPRKRHHPLRSCPYKEDLSL